MNKIFISALMVIIPAISLADYVDTLRYKIKDIDSQLKAMTIQLDMTKPEEAEQLINDIYYLRLDRLSYQRDLYKETVADPNELETKLRDLDLQRDDLDRKHQNAITAAEREIKPAVQADSLSVIETKRSYGYVYYSIKLDIDNPGPAGQVFITVKGKRYDGHELESLYLTADLDSDSKATLTDSTMVSTKDAMNISKWEVADVKFYPN
jgi:uncharacterized protein YoxC